MKRVFCIIPLLFTTTAFAQTWTTKQSMPDGRHRHCAQAGTDASGTKRVYVFSGGSDSQAYDSVHGYNPGNDTWATFADIPTPRVLATSAALSGRIYVIGGISTGFSNGLDTVEAYEPATDTWTTLAPLPVTLSAAAAAAANGKIYVFGGHQPNSGITLATTYEYDPIADAWTQKASMPGPARNIGAARVCNGKIYVIGYNVNYEYNPTSNTWAVKTPAPTSQNGRGVVAGSDQRIYLINDRNYNTSSDPIVYFYRFTNDTWYQAPNNIKGYTNLAAAHLNNKLYVTGGTVRFGPYTDNVEQSSALASCSCWKKTVLCMVDATVALSDKVRVADIQPGGGVVFEHGNATEVSVGWEPLLVGPGTSLTVTGHGLVNGVQDHEGGRLTFVDEGGIVRVLGDFAAVAADSWRVEAYDRGRLVAVASGQGPLASLKASIWPMAAGLARGPGGEASLVASFERATAIQGDGLDVMADEIRIVAESGLVVEHTDRVQLSADKLAEIIITDLATAP